MTTFKKKAAALGYSATSPILRILCSPECAVFVGEDPDPDNNERIIGWAKEYWEAVHPHSGGGAYVNFMMDEGQERVQATYRDNFEKLVAIKNEYDSTNLFRVNQNIRPTATV